MIATTYPSEILEGRLFLGDYIHAQDKTILKNLRITHILNVSHNIPNYFEDDGKLGISLQCISYSRHEHRVLENKH